MKVSPELYEKLVGKSKENKYHNIKTTYDGILFDSKKESQIFARLKLMEKIGLIKDLELQCEYLLIPSFELNGKKYRKSAYICDFRYFSNEDNKIHVIDVKGVKTDVYKLKKKMMAYIHKIEIEEW